MTNIDTEGRSVNATTIPSETTAITRRRISWAELCRQRPDLRPANDDSKEQKAA